MELENKIATAPRRDLHEKSKRMRLTGRATKEESRWQSLPHDVLVSVFQRLKPTDILKGASQCCRSWYEASKDPNCWQILDFSDYIPDRGDSGLMQHRRFLKLLVFTIHRRARGSTTELHFPSSLLQGADHLFYAAPRCPRLKYFSMTLGRRMSIDQEERVCAAIRMLKDLEAMDVDSYLLGGMDAGIDGRMLNGPKVLRAIEGSCSGFTGLRVRNLVFDDVAESYISSLSRLRALQLTGVVFPTWDPLCNVLRSCRQLKYLDISDSRGHLTGFDDLFRMATSQLEEFCWDNLHSLY